MQIHKYLYLLVILLSGLKHLKELSVFLEESESYAQKKMWKSRKKSLFINAL